MGGIRGVYFSSSIALEETVLQQHRAQAKNKTSRCAKPKFVQESVQETFTRTTHHRQATALWAKCALLPSAPASPPPSTPRTKFNPTLRDGDARNTRLVESYLFYTFRVDASMALDMPPGTRHAVCIIVCCPQILTSTTQAQSRIRSKQQKLPLQVHTFLARGED